MPNLDALKQMNRPQEAQQTVTTPYLPQVSAIPTREWNAMLQSQMVLVERLTEMGQYIATLPTTQVIRKTIRDYCQGIYDNQGDMLCRVIQTSTARFAAA